MLLAITPGRLQSGHTTDNAPHLFAGVGPGSFQAVRYAAPLSLQDTDSVVDSLETGLGLLIHFIFFIFYLLVWGINIVKGFSTFSATVLALTFVFGDSVKSVFEVREACCSPHSIQRFVARSQTTTLRSSNHHTWM